MNSFNYNVLWCLSSIITPTWFESQTFQRNTLYLHELNQFVQGSVCMCSHDVYYLSISIQYNCASQFYPFTWLAGEVINGASMAKIDKEHRPHSWNGVAVRAGTGWRNTGWSSIFWKWLENTSSGCLDSMKQAKSIIDLLKGHSPRISECCKNS